MAHMIPRQPPEEGPGRTAELALWHALNAGLHDEWFVYYGLRYVDAQANEGEIDFLCLHRTAGLLLIECKGRGVQRSGEGRWTRQTDQGVEELRETPFEQAQRQVKALVGQLSARWRRMGSGEAELPLIHGHAVAFPRARLSEGAPLPLEVQPQTVFDLDDLPKIGDRVLEALTFWQQARRQQVTPLEPGPFKNFRQTVLHPRFGIVQRLSTDLAADEQVLVRVSEEQAQIMGGWLGNRRLRIVGGAGTGKTVLALAAARQFAAEGAQVLLVCFNRPLAEGLEALAAGDDAGPGNLLVRNFHRLCAAAHWALHEQPLDVPDEQEARRHFWADEAPLFLAEAVERGLLTGFDAIVVDEGQDFAPLWWAVLEGCLREPDAGHLLVFADTEQDLHGRSGDLPEMPELRLSVNFRNTRAIARDVARLGQNKTQPAPRCPEGEPPALHEQGAPGQTLRQVEQVVERLLVAGGLAPEQIAILTPHTRPNSVLKDCQAIAGVALSEDPLKRQGQLLHSTISRFKGLESDVVLLLDVVPDDPRAGRRARYVAASRARHRLHVWLRGGW